ncbi:hypothetical protein [Bradyrhizobium sp. McL0615]|uniref:hypothetical protein n=1 Tax=Bradyrhizobium sp. McL0615 TaxID=3415673 RepID=UPI003CFAAAC2
MASFFKRAIEVGGHATTVWTFIPAAVQTAITAALSGVTAYFGYHELGIARAIFLATGVMAFGLSVVFLWVRLSQMLGMYHRLSLASIGTPNVSLDSEQKPTTITGITFQCVLRNDSQAVMFYQLRKTNIVLEQRVPSQRAVDDNVVVISPFGGTQSISFATIENIPFQNRKDLRISGQIEIEIAYGPAKDDLKFLFLYAANVQVAFGKNPSQKNHSVVGGTSITKYEHTKAKQ